MKKSITVYQLDCWDKEPTSIDTMSDRIEFYATLKEAKESAKGEAFYLLAKVKIDPDEINTAIEYRQNEVWHWLKAKPSWLLS